MRAILPIVSLLIAMLSLVLDVFAPATGSPLRARICFYGGCRYDQIYAGVDTVGPGATSLFTNLITADPANPLVWCAYAELLSANGETAQAEAGFEHAVSLGPGMSPVLMRAANFDFSHGRGDHGVLMASRILSQTGAFDQILFSYLLQSGLPVSRLTNSVIPAAPRAARSWLEWLSVHNSDGDLLSTWHWMREHNLVGPKSASDLAWTLWNRKSYQAAQGIWSDWFGSTGGDYLHPQRLANRRFEDTSNPSPFDWTVVPLASVEFLREDGLQIRFSGTDNVDLYQVRQFATVSPGRYRFSAEVQADGLTTDQRPFFHVFDPIRPDAVNVIMEPLNDTVPRSWISVQFTVPAGTQALEIQLERHPSQRFANRIAGTMHLYQVSLVPQSYDDSNH